MNALLRGNDTSIKRIHYEENCTEHCTPVNMDVFFNTPRLKVCKTFDDQFCGQLKVLQYLSSAKDISKKHEIVYYLLDLEEAHEMGHTWIQLEPFSSNLFLI